MKFADCVTSTIRESCTLGNPFNDSYGEIHINTSDVMDEAVVKPLDNRLWRGNIR